MNLHNVQQKHVFERGIAKCVCTTGEQYTTLLEKKSITVKWINSSFRIQIQEWVNNKKRKSKKPPQHGQVMHLKFFGLDSNSFGHIFTLNVRDTYICNCYLALIVVKKYLTNMDN